MVGVPENERVIVGGDLNGHVGGRKGGEERWHGGGGYGKRNEEGKKIVEFAVAFDLVIMNTYFQRKREKLITYRSGENISQIDYILCRRKYGGEVRNTNIIYGEGINTT
ncbi:craniofacial development protein 2-like [Schistocerca serialis cubense]|uniref:craniofacial development protein 2-like n=1 Tax=Schistocerca serialis cubense TaxID=2023355 RepID=UPI00214E4589|nr:craniofacial development protein 2-like [Schistocerca serialis cubense]